MRRAPNGIARLAAQWSSLVEEAGATYVVELKDQQSLAKTLAAKVRNKIRRETARETYGLSGDFGTWEEAVASSTGYDSDAILSATKTALIAVRDGKAVYERDSVLFFEPEYAWPLLAGLMWAAARSGGVLNVLDFGGSLGSTYFQNRSLLTTLESVRWNVVEQSSHVAAGKSEFESEELRFYHTLDDCKTDTQPNVLLLSSVLQYLEHPYAVLDQVVRAEIPQVIIDRTPFWNGPTDRLCVQAVPPDIYEGSYPSWIFSESGFDSRVNENFKVVAKFENADWMPSPVKTTYQGRLLVPSLHRSS
ncbi:MAG: methyltransferase, TIGR04325 family [Gemmatimonadales bacterium]